MYSTKIKLLIYSTENNVNAFIEAGVSLEETKNIIEKIIVGYNRYNEDEELLQKMIHVLDFSVQDFDFGYSNEELFNKTMSATFFMIEWLFELLGNFIPAGWENKDIILKKE